MPPALIPLVVQFPVPSPLDFMGKLIAKLATQGIQALASLFGIVFWLLAKLNFSLINLVDTQVIPFLDANIQTYYTAALDTLRPALWGFIIIAIGLIALRFMASPLLLDSNIFSYRTMSRLVIWSLVFTIFLSATGGSNNLTSLYLLIEGSNGRTAIGDGIMEAVSGGQSLDDVALRTAYVHPDDLAWDASSMSSLPRYASPGPPQFYEVTDTAPRCDEINGGYDTRSIGARYNCKWPDGDDADYGGIFLEFMRAIVEGQLYLAVAFFVSFTPLFAGLLKVVLLLQALLLFAIFPVAIAVALYEPFERFAIDVIRNYGRLWIITLIANILLGLAARIQHGALQSEWIFGLVVGIIAAIPAYTLLRLSAEIATEILTSTVTGAMSTVGAPLGFAYGSPERLPAEIIRDLTRSEQAVTGGVTATGQQMWGMGRGFGTAVRQVGLQFAPAPSAADSPVATTAPLSEVTGTVGENGTAETPANRRRNRPLVLTPASPIPVDTEDATKMVAGAATGNVALVAGGALSALSAVNKQQEAQRAAPANGRNVQPLSSLSQATPSRSFDPMVAYLEAQQGSGVVADGNDGTPSVTVDTPPSAAPPSLPGETQQRLATARALSEAPNETRVIRGAPGAPSGVLPNGSTAALPAPAPTVSVAPTVASSSFGTEREVLTPDAVLPAPSATPSVSMDTAPTPNRSGLIVEGQARLVDSTSRPAVTPATGGGANDSAIPPSEAIAADLSPMVQTAPDAAPTIPTAATTSFGPTAPDGNANRSIPVVAGTPPVVASAPRTAGTDGTTPPRTRMNRQQIGQEAQRIRTGIRKAQPWLGDTVDGINDASLVELERQAGQVSRPDLERRVMMFEPLGGNYKMHGSVARLSPLELALTATTYYQRGEQESVIQEANYPENRGEMEEFLVTNGLEREDVEGLPLSTLTSLYDLQRGNLPTASGDDDGTFGDAPEASLVTAAPSQAHRTSGSGETGASPRATSATTVMPASEGDAASRGASRALVTPVTTGNPSGDTGSRRDTGSSVSERTNPLAPEGGEVHSAPQPIVTAIATTDERIESSFRGGREQTTDEGGTAPTPALKRNDAEDYLLWHDPEMKVETLREMSDDDVQTTAYSRWSERDPQQEETSGRPTIAQRHMTEWRDAGETALIEAGYESDTVRQMPIQRLEDNLRREQERLTADAQARGQTDITTQMPFDAWVRAVGTPQIPPQASNPSPATRPPVPPTNTQSKG